LFSLLLRCAPDQEDLLIAELQECLTLGITEEAGGLRAFFDAGTDREALTRRFAKFSPEIREEAAQDWEQATRDAWPPLEIRERWFLVAPWHAGVETPRGKRRLETYPGMTCGTGRHPATQLCLRAIERYVRPGARVLDVGSGSGILSDAARLMGAACVIGCDIDEENVRIASERVPVPMFVGSAEAVRSEWADVVIANIDAATIEQIAGELERVRKPGGTLILSGFEEHDPPEGFKALDRIGQDGWSCSIC
jgi:ribosomal protein L11 methyltransferase